MEDEDDDVDKAFTATQSDFNEFVHQEIISLVIILTNKGIITNEEWKAAWVQAGHIMDEEQARLRDKIYAKYPLFKLINEAMENHE